MVSSKSQRFAAFIANSGISEEDLEEILTYKDLLIQKGMSEDRHFRRATAKGMEHPPGPPLPYDRIRLILSLFNPSELQLPGGFFLSVKLWTACILLIWIKLQSSHVDNLLHTQDI